MGALLHILHIEDDEDDALLVERALKRSGCAVAIERVCSEQGLREVLATTVYDIVLSDYNMPNFSGATALEMVRAHDADLPFVLVSGAVGEEIAVEMMRRGAQDYIMKGSLQRLGPVVVREYEDGKIDKLHKRAEAEVLKLSQAVEQSASMVIICDVDGQVEYVNRRFVEVTGYAREEIVGANPRMVKSGDMPAETYRQLWSALNSGKSWSGELCNKKKNGQRYWVQASIAPVRNPAGEITNFLAIEEDISERKLWDDQLQAQLKEKEVLLKEVHHRVKNNLQLVASLFNMQTRREESQSVRNVLSDGYNRVQSLALVHERLYRSESLDKVDFLTYVQRLVRDLKASFLNGYDHIAVRENIESVDLDIDTAVSCGLIINELLSNALKHAFPNGECGEIYVEFYRRENQYCLVVRDDGVGLPANRDLSKSDSLGLKLVHILTRQMLGAIEIDRAGRGLRFSITIPVPSEESSKAHG